MPRLLLATTPTPDDLPTRNGGPFPQDARAQLAAGAALSVALLLASLALLAQPQPMNRSFAILNPPVSSADTTLGIAATATPAPLIFAGAPFTISDHVGSSPPRAAYNSAEREFFAVWGGLDGRIDGRRVTATGQPTGAVTTIATSTQGVAIAFALETNEYLVVWADGRDGTGRVVYGQKVSALGEMTESDFLIAGGPAQYGSPVVAYNAALGQYLVVWHDGINQRILGRRLSISGTLLSDVFPLSIPAIGERSAPAVAYSQNDDQYLIVWADARNSRLDIYGQRLLGTGAYAGTNFTITSAPNDQTSPAVVFNQTSNEYFVAWSDPAGGSLDIMGRRVAPSGTLVGDFIPLCLAPDQQFSPALAYGSVNNEVLVSWFGNQDLAQLVFGKLATAEGVPLTSDTFVSPYDPFAPVGAGYPSVAYDSFQNKYLVTWYGQLDSSTQGVIGRLVTGGTPPSPTPTTSPTATPSPIPSATPSSTPTATPTATATPTPVMIYLPVILRG